VFHPLTVTDAKRPARPTRNSNIFDASPFLPDVPKGRNIRDSLHAMEALVRPSELSTVFQPIVRFDTLEVFAYEALLRCTVEQFRSPPVLFERAMQDKCVGRLGRMVREVAIPLSTGHPIFVNVHPHELEESWLVRPDDPMNFHDRDVFLEITESVPMTHFTLCRDVLREVRSRPGFHLVVDDLGAGYSNFGRIADLEPAVVKIDKGLIDDIVERLRTRTLVTGLVRLCGELGAKVVIEGIETFEQFIACRDTGAHYAQGYFLARPGFPLPKVQDTVQRLALPKRTF
jgi:EAL domain-containing protein (putative c-di-GMP-specific phosphodiesterase class I)